MYGFKCDNCEYVTQNEDDHTVTDDGDYLCLECAKKLNPIVAGVPYLTRHTSPPAPSAKPCPR